MQAAVAVVFIKTQLVQEQEAKVVAEEVLLQAPTETQMLLLLETVLLIEAVAEAVQTVLHLQALVEKEL
jgi:cell division protein FtsX